MDRDINRKSKEPWLAVILSMIFPGLGQIYSSRVMRGIFIIIIQNTLICFGGWLLLSATGSIMASIYIGLTIFIIYIWNLFDAHKCGVKANSKDIEEFRQNNKDPWLAVFLSLILPGLGHIYIKRWFLGIVFVVSTIILSIIIDATSLYLFFGTIFSLCVCCHAYIVTPVRKEISKNIILLLAIIFFASAFMGKYFAIIIKNNIVQAFKIPSGAMLDTLNIGDHLLANKFIYSIREPQRGDIIVFKFPGDKKKDYIKRLIGMPGDKLEIRNQHVYINDVLLDEPYAVHKDIRKNIPQRDNFGPIIIPMNAYFMMGDNRDRSSDSRFWGLLKRELIEGKAYKIYWPSGRWGPIE
ncbi:MAG: signal peptidase I [bacterium]